MKVKIFLLLLCLGLTACKELNGTVTLHRDTQVADKKGHSSLVAKGSYRASLKYYEKKRRIQLKIKDAIQGKKDTTLKINVPAGVIIPERSGPIHLKAKQTGQFFDLHGDLKTDTAYSGRRRGVEPCNYTAREYVCHEVCHDRKDYKKDKSKRDRDRSKKPRPKCRKKCSHKHASYSGFRDVGYHYVTKTVILDAKLNHPSSFKAIGDLNVSRSDSHKIYDFSGICR